ncbi:MAG: flagellar hook-basal body complex protein FliE [Clostridiales bacterium]|nr:flagellar hook-basal body complex protein FliE [Clostridiales bacterium]
MDITSLTGITSDYINTIATENQLVATDDSFQSVLDAAVNMLNETNDLENDATAAEMEFALGLADNPHDMQIAAKKALTALQYTTAVRDKMLEAYKEIMNMQI